MAVIEANAVCHQLHANMLPSSQYLFSSFSELADMVTVTSHANEIYATAFYTF